MSSSSSDSTREDKAQTEEMSENEVRQIQWEEWALSLEEHFHAQELYARNPGGLPMGHHR